MIQDLERGVGKKIGRARLDCVYVYIVRRHMHICDKYCRRFKRNKPVSILLMAQILLEYLVESPDVDAWKDAPRDDDVVVDDDDAWRRDLSSPDRVVLGRRSREDASRRSMRGCIRGRVVVGGVGEGWAGEKAASS